MPLIYNPIRKQFLCADWPFPLRDLPRKAGFQWSPSAKIWHTTSVYKAYALREHATGEAAARLARVHYNIQSSSAAEPVFEPNNGLYPFQAAGVEELVERYRAGRRYLMLTDEQGLGKTPQSICFANEIGAKRLLVICPASLRLNWAREIERWHGLSPGTQALLTGKQEIDPELSVITSYALASHTKDEKFDLIIIDECHAVKNPEAKRTKLLLGDGEEERGLVADTPAIFLSGTPEPNGKPNELYSILRRCAPDVTDNASYWNFIRRFCVIVDNDIGGPVIMGAKNRGELYVRLRGSGLMVRRLKKNVLKDLPPKRYKMVVFPAEGDLVKVLKREEAFSAKEILKYGVPVGSALPEIRREMGLAKVELCADYIKSMLEDGVQKVVAFAHHIEVMKELSRRLQRYVPVTVMGSTPQKKRQAAVDAFQNDPKVRVFIGNEAAEEGITLTAAQDMVSVESEWVPGKNDQRADRLHRIGQKGSVLVHYLVVENSLDAHILSKAAGKADDIERTLDR